MIVPTTECAITETVLVMKDGMERHVLIFDALMIATLMESVHWECAIAMPTGLEPTVQFANVPMLAPPTESAAMLLITSALVMANGVAVTAV